MADYTQESRRLVLETPLGKDVFLLTSFLAQEEISKLYSYRLEMLSSNPSIAAKDIVGKNVTIGLRLLDDTLRYFNGYVSRFAFSGTDEHFSHYTAEVVPWLWFLTRISDCRIFQDKSAPEIIEEVFQDVGFEDYEVPEIKGQHPKRDYCVQYRETDFNFVSRLMEEEGIFYYFRHENGKHTLVLGDRNKAFKDCLEKEVDLSSQGAQAGDQITSWEHRYEYRSGKFALNDYNFETPSANLLAKTNTLVKLDNINAYELYDYPGLYGKKAEGDALVKVRMEEEEVPYDMVVASSRCRTFGPGGKFKIKKAQSKADEGKTYHIIAIHHSARETGSYVTGGRSSQLDYSNTFTCIPDSATFRPARIAPKPIVRGVQTAVVVGPQGEEIFTDKYGRVKAQFFWDRDGKKDDKSSCWIRVAQILAGNGWGAMSIPRIGQEVIVDFLEGDPDRPIITGCVYNAGNMPPYPLPDKQTVFTIKSNSSKGGWGFNEIRLEDKKGEEQIFIHAEKDQDIQVKNDYFETIGRNRSLIVKGDQLDQVDKNRHEKIGQNLVVEIGKDQNLKVKGKEAKEVAGAYSLTVKGDCTEVFKGNHSEDTQGNIYLKAMGIVIEASQGITLKSGSNSVVIDSVGVTATGSLVTIDGKMTKINSGPGSPAASGQAGSAESPVVPEKAQEADMADPGKSAEIQAQRREKEKAKSASTGVAAGGAAEEEPAPDEDLSWIGIELKNDKGDPIPDEPYEIKLPDGEIRSGTLDKEGKARIAGIPKGSQCDIRFPEIDKDEWRPA